MYSLILASIGTALLGVPPVNAAPGLLSAPAPAPSAESVAGAEDPRWLPWVGCWESVDGAAAGDDLLVCFRPLSGIEGVEIVTISGSETISTEEVRTDVRVPVADGGCEGEQWAEWSADGRRLFVHSTMECGAGVTRATRGVLAIHDGGRSWLEIHSVEVGDAEPVLAVTSFRPAGRERVERAEIDAPDEGRRLAVTTVRSAAARNLRPDDVGEAVGQIGSAATRALIVESNQSFRLDANTLRTLKAEGVPEEVLDVMVAMSYPETFGIMGGTHDPVYQGDAPRRTAPSDAYGPRRDYGGYSIYGSRFYGYGPSFYGGYAPYGYGSTRGYYGPPVVIIQPPVVVQERPRLIRGRGYTAPSSSTRPVRPAGAAPNTPPSSSRSPAATPTRRATPPPAAESGGTSGGTEERRARRRGEGGGGGS